MHNSHMPNMPLLRPAAVAGLFYPSGAEELRATVEHLLKDVPESGGVTPKAVIAPHAGYIYSGPVAASVYRHLTPLNGRVRRVILLGPAHRVAVRGLALPAADAFATPLGPVPVDADAVEALRSLPQVSERADVHAQEHSLEVQLPFLQQVLGEFSLVPLVVGDASAEEVAEVLQVLWGGDETLIVVSSDLSHYHEYGVAQRMDRSTSAAIESLRYEDIGYEQACGRAPISGLLLEARQRGLHARLVDLRNSGDTAGPRDHVVGYGAYVLS
ncbi:MAG: AmmeMemoRadiSam system protein B [Acidiferrobacteraceae bacterium]